MEVDENITEQLNSIQQTLETMQKREEATREEYRRIFLGIQPASSPVNYPNRDFRATILRVRN